MLKIIEWITYNWKALLMVGAFIFLFSLIRPLADMFRNAKLGIKEVFTPLGFVIFIVLIVFGIYIYTFFKGGLMND